MRNDHDLKIYVDATTYLALRWRCHETDRSLSEHVRHLIRVDLTQALADESGKGRGDEGETEGKA